jgi:uncharacterized membrane-anchored protein YitT (DUF2179 family)
VDATPIERHALWEDVLAILLGTLFISLGVAICNKSVLLVGGLVGMSLLLHYGTKVSFWLIFSLINLPFYILALRRMGWQFTLRTFAAVCIVSMFSYLTTKWVAFSYLDPVYASFIGGGLFGIGLLMLFRHRTGLGGLNILAIYVQEKWGIRAGYLQLVFDLAILTASFFVISSDRFGLSIVAATVLNLMIAINHRPGRYLGIS